MNALWAAFQEINNLRRTTKNFDGREVPKDIIQDLIREATKAPNHKLNEPWRFRVLNRAGVLKWIEHLQKKLSAEDLKSFEGPLARVQNVGALIYVSSVIDSNPVTDLENTQAVSAAIQNLLLGASALGLASYWATGNLMKHPIALQKMGLPESERLMGVIWLGYGELPTPKSRKDPETLTIWL